jgi:chromosome segregation ATPase
MKKLLIIGIIGAVALFVVMKKTNVCSYAGTLFSQVSSEAKNAVPARFELDRIRHEIAALDGDISQMVRPIAEYKVAIEKMRKDIDRSQAKIAEGKKTLLAVVEDLKGNPDELPFSGKMWKADRVRKQLARDTERLKQQEKQLKAQQQVLEAKEQALAATQDQLAKVIAKKREYEVRLAELEAEEETLAVARIGTEFKFDNGRATHIEESLAAAEQRIRVTQHELQMKANELTTIPLNDRTGPADLNSIRSYLEGKESGDKTASNK